MDANWADWLLNALYMSSALAAGEHTAAVQSCIGFASSPHTCHLGSRCKTPAFPESQTLAASGCL